MTELMQCLNTLHLLIHKVKITKGEGNAMIIGVLKTYFFGKNLAENELVSFCIL